MNLIIPAAIDANDFASQFLGDSAVEPKFKALRDAGIPVFTVDHVSQYSVNNSPRILITASTLRDSKIS
jgi:hypothetical protein